MSSLGVLGMSWHPQILADQLTLSQPGGTDYAHLITTGTPNFQTFWWPWGLIQKITFCRTCQNKIITFWLSNLYVLSNLTSYLEYFSKGPKSLSHFWAIYEWNSKIGSTLFSKFTKVGHGRHSLCSDVVTLRRSLHNGVFCLYLICWQLVIMFGLFIFDNHWIKI